VCPPRLGRLQHPERVTPLRQRPAGDDDVVGLCDQRRKPRDPVRQRLPDRVSRRIEEVHREDEPLDRRYLRGRLPEQNRADARQHLRLAGEPADGVVARRQRDGAGRRDAAPRRPDAVEAAEARRQPNRPAGIAADGEVDETGGRHRGRAARGTAGDTARRRRIVGCAVVGVLPGEAPGELVGLRLADQTGAGLEQPRDDVGIGRRHRVRRQPVRAAGAGRQPGDVEQVLDAEARPGERPAGPALSNDMPMGTEGVGGIGVCMAHA
jgi:hypothetical protein